MNKATDDREMTLSIGKASERSAAHEAATQGAVDLQDTTFGVAESNTLVSISTVLVLPFRYSSMNVYTFGSIDV